MVMGLRSVRSMVRRAAAVAAALLLAAAVQPRARAAEDVPQAVLDAKLGVVRIVSVAGREGEDGVYTGSGFAVGEADSSEIHIITNCHVVEDCDRIYVYYNTGEYVEAAVLKEDRARDIAVLKPKKSIPGIQALALETDPVPEGAAVYGLGYPGAADYFAEGDADKQFDSLDDFMDTVIADKPSMTITDGIISATHSSVLMGNQTRQVKTIQTNTAINSGNSGGPLLNRAGRVVGVNTMTILVADQMNGSVHVEELVRVLRTAGVAYSGTPARQAGQDDDSVSSTGGAPAGSARGGGALTLVLIAGVTVLLLGGCIAALVLVARRGKKGRTLAAFEAAGRGVELSDAAAMTEEFVQNLLPLAGYDLNPLMTPDNIMISESGVRLKNTGSDAPAGALPGIFPGFCAPEVFEGRAAGQATVYFVGAVAYTLVTGMRPQEAPARKRTGLPAINGGGVLGDIINRAMNPYEHARIPDLQTLHMLLRSREQIVI